MIFDCRHGINSVILWRQSFIMTEKEHDTNLNVNVGTHGSCVHYAERKSPRAVFHNYSGGSYFVTICTKDKEHYFGKIVENEMLMSKIGVYCQTQIDELPLHYKYAEVPIYVVMPNHIHLIICIDAKWTHEPCVPTQRTALSVVVGGLKRSVTLFARRNNINFGWQSRYHDHIIRGTRDGNNIAEYIKNNVIHLANDCFY